MKTKPNTLFIFAFIIWCIAGFNVLKVGISSRAALVLPLDIVFSALVFSFFNFFVFKKVTNKHYARIIGYGEEKQYFWNFMDLKSLIIMIFMISLGVWLRSSGVASERFIAVFYIGLGLALFMTGLTFAWYFIKNLKSMGRN